MRGDSTISSTTRSRRPTGPTAPHLAPEGAGDYRARALRALAEHGRLPSAATLAAAEVAVRDAVAVADPGTGLRLALARAAARLGCPTTPRRYAEHLGHAADPGPPLPSDLAALAEHGAWDLVAAWADGPGLLAVLASGCEGPAVPALLARHDEIATGSVPAPTVGTGAAAPPAVAGLASAAADVLRRPLPGAVRALEDAVDRVRRAHGCRAGEVASGTALLVRAAAVGPEDLLADPRGPRPPADVPEPPPADAAVADRLRSRWLDGAALLAGWAARGEARDGAGPAPRSPLARWAVVAARAERAVAAGRELGAEVDRTLAAALRAAGGDTGLTRRLRAALALDALRTGNLCRAGAEVAALDGLDPDRDRAVRLAHLVGVLAADWTAAPPWSAPEGVVGDAEALPGGHPVALAARAVRLAGLLRTDPAAFADDAGPLADDVLRRWASGHRFPLSLRVVQAQTLLRLGRATHAERVARYVRSRLETHLPDDVGLAAAADLTLLRARLATGDAAALAEPWPRLGPDADALRRALASPDGAPAIPREAEEEPA